MTVRLVPLGTNGFIPTQGRQTMSYLLLTQDEAILLDAGSGVSRLLEEPLASLVNQYAALNVVFSHYHLDHTVGLTYFTAVWPQKPIHIYAPGWPLLGVAGEEALNNLIKPPNFPLTLDKFPAPVTMTPVTENTLQIGGVSIRLRSQKHAGGSVGMRFGDDMAYTTDTVVDEQTISFARGVKLLLHELWLDDTDAAPEEATRTGHSYASGVAKIATEAGVGSLMIVHHHPKRTMVQIRKTAQTVQSMTPAHVIVPEEGKVYDIA